MLSCQDLGLCEEGDKSLGGLLMLLGLGVVGCGNRGAALLWRLSLRVISNKQNQMHIFSSMDATNFSL